MKGQHQSLVELCNDFGDSTSMHGVRRAVGSGETWRRPVWTLLVLCGTGWAVYQLVEIMREFYRYPVSTLVSVEYRSKLSFPAVTICNLNRLRSSRLDDRLRHNISTLHKKRAKHQRSELDILSRDYSEESRSEMGHLIEDMLIDCTFDLRECSSKDFHMRNFHKSGNCYTFGDTIHDKRKRHTKKIGPANGLVLELEIGRRHYLSLTPSVGLKILIHNNSEYVFPPDSGMVAGPGYSTSIGIKRFENYLLPPPYGICVDGNSEVSRKKNMYAHWGYAYTNDECRRTCFQVALLKSCNCTDDNIPGGVGTLLGSAEATSKYGNHSVPECDTKLHGKCLRDTEKNNQVDGFGCADKCPPPCDSVKYDKFLSQAVWPAEGYLRHFLRKVNMSYHRRNQTFPQHGASEDYVRKNFMRLEIHYESMEYEVKRTIPSYDWNKVLSDVGGQLGLWLGFSILTAVELGEFGLNLLLLLFRKIRRSGHLENISEKA